MTAEHLQEPPGWLESEPDEEALAEIRRNERISARVETLRLEREARQRFAAEQEPPAAFDQAFLTRTQLQNLPAPDPLIARVLPRHCYAILRGRDHAFKSFVAIDWALCLATGKQWQGHEAEQVPVLYIAGEGAHGLRRRVDAWEYAWGEVVPDHMFVVRTTALNLHQPGPAFDHLLEHVGNHNYGLVVVDTLRRVSGAADGNSSEMGLVIDNLDRIKRATTNGSVLAVAHTDKGDHDTRGYSGIEDDADVVWSAKRDDTYLTLQLAKMKDGRDGLQITLQTQSVLDSLVLSAPDGDIVTNTTEQQIAILNALRLVPEDKATGPELMAVSGLTKASFYRALKELMEGTSPQIFKEMHGKTGYYRLPDQALTDPEVPEP